jgi:gluconolactonase
VWEGGKRAIRAFDVVVDGTKLTNSRALVTVDEKGGGSDGIRVDVDGNLWCGWNGDEGLDGVAIFSPAGKLIGRINLPERCANLCFGGRHRNRLFMCASTSVFSLFVNTQGAI